MADVLRPHGTGGEVGGRRGNMLQLGRFDPVNMDVKDLSRKDDRDAKHGDSQRFHGFHDDWMLLSQK